MRLGGEKVGMGGEELMRWGGGGDWVYPFLPGKE